MEDARTSYDLDERERLYYTFQQVFADDVPSVLLFYAVSTYFVTDEVDGVSPGVFFDSSSRFRNVYEWTFKRAPDIRTD